MAEAVKPSPTPEPATAPTATPIVSGFAQVLREFWQVPLLIVGVGGVATALWYARSHAPVHDFDAALAQAEELIASDDLDQATYILSDVVERNLEKAPKEIEPRLRALQADAIARDLRTSAKPTKAEDERLVNAYDRAQTVGWTMTPSQIVTYSQSLVRVGRAAEALAAVSEGASAQDAEALRQKVRRDALASVLQGASESGKQTPKALLAAIEQFRTDPNLSASDAAWAAARAAEQRIASDSCEVAADRLLVDLSRIEGTPAARGIASPQELAELYQLRGEALRRLNQLNKARDEFQHAATIVQAGTPVAGAIDVGLGRTNLALGDYEGAEKVFDAAVLAQHAGTLGHEARLGRAEARSHLGKFADAEIDFAVLLESAHRDELSKGTRHSMQRVLVERARDALAEKRWLESAELARVAVQLGEDGEHRADALVVLGTAARAEADRILKTPTGATSALADLVPDDRIAVNRLLKEAGDAFVDFSGTPACRQASDDTYVESLRNAAACYDIAGLHEEALAQCQLLLEALQPEDPDRADVFIRIAAIREAEGAFSEAIVNYKRAIDLRRDGSEYTTRAIVPLARVLAADGRADEATSHLQSVLSGDFGLKPEAVEYFNALDLLAKIQFSKARFTESAELLHEAIVRCPDPTRLGELRFRLGEAYIGVSRGALKESQVADATAATKARLARDAHARLADARRIFEQAIQAFEEQGSDLDGLSRDMQRESYMRRADCAFDMGDFEDAIALYEAVDRKYPEHPSSMVALIQIVNACDSLADATRAETAHRRAQLRLTQLSDESFFGGAGIMSRESWELWLRNHPPSRSRVASAPAEVEP